MLSGDKEMRKRVIKILLAVVLCWSIYVTLEGIRLVGSTDPGKYPVLRLSGSQIQDELAEYGSLGFSVKYHLSYGDSFEYGEIYILRIKAARWE